MALGADAVAVSNSALQAIGCLGMRACGHDHLNKFCIDDLTTFDREMAHLTGIDYAGVSLD